MEPSPNDGAAGFFLRWVERAGVALMTAVGMLVPVFVLPFTRFDWYDLDQPEVIAAKNTLLILLAGGVLVLGAIALWGPGWRRFRGLTAVVCGCLLGFLAWGALATVLGPAPVLGWRAWLPGGMAVAAAVVGGPLFLYRTRRVVVVLLGILLGGAMVAGIGLTSVAGSREFNRAFYGLDPRDVFDSESLMARTGMRPQGGMRSSAALSTLGNPEYAGTYAAAVLALTLLVLFDWAPRVPAGWRRWAARGALLAMAGAAALLMAATGSRQALIAVALAGLMRLVIFVGVPALPVAAGFCAVLLAALLLGVVPAAVLGVILVLAMLAWGLRFRGLAPRVSGADRFNLGLTFGLPAVLVVLLVAFSTPGPWNPSGFRVLQRFSSLLSKKDESFRERAVMFMLASEMVHDSPLLGVGPGRYANQFSPAYARLVDEDDSGVLAFSRKQIGRKIGTQTHNDYLQIAAEQGLPALMLLLSAMVVLLGGLARVAAVDAATWRGAVAVAVLGTLVAFLSIMMSSFPLHMPSRTAVFWMLVGCGLGLLAKRR